MRAITETKASITAMMRIWVCTSPWQDLSILKTLWVLVPQSKIAVMFEGVIVEGSAEGVVIEDVGIAEEEQEEAVEGEAIVETAVLEVQRNMDFIMNILAMLILRG
jgi:hypothetical protein